MTRRLWSGVLGLALACAASPGAAPDSAAPAVEIATRGAIEPDAGADDAAELDLLVLDGATSLDFSPSTAFDLGSAGTIEFLVSADWTEDPGYFPCILASRDVYAGEDPAGLATVTRYSVHISGDRRAIGLWNGTGWGAVPYDFSDGEFHRVALVTEGARTAIHVDGQSRGEVEIGYGSATGQPFHIGSADGGSEFFQGSLSGLRLWRVPLGAEALEALAEFDGPPDPGDPNAAALVAYSAFTESDPTLVLSESPPVP